MAANERIEWMNNPGTTRESKLEQPPEAIAKSTVDVNITYINEKSAKIKEATKALSEVVKYVVSNKDTPQHIRWDIFVRSGCGEEVSLGSVTISAIQDSRFFSRWDRYQIATAKDIVDNYISEMMSNNNTAYKAGGHYTLREELLQKFIKSIKIEW